jgi:CysZ protein
MKAVQSDIPDEMSRWPATSAWEDFREGLMTPWDGLRYMSRNPALWRYGILPVVVNLLITGLLLMILIATGVYFFTAIHPKFGDGWLWGLAELLVAGLFVVAVIGLAVAAWMTLQTILCGWFYDRLARQVELQIGTRPEDLRDVPLWPQAVDALRAVSLLVLVNAGCIVVQIVPGVGTVLGLCGSYYFTCSTLGFEYFDYPLSLRGLRRSEKLAFTRRHRPHTLGLGTAVAMLAVIPVVNAVFLTTAVTGAVLLHRRLKEPTAAAVRY